MEQDEVLAVLGALEARKMRLWVAGGWGVDALVGRQTREHRDLDLLVDAERLEECLSILAARGYAVETDWPPVRVEVVAGERGWVDVHPMRLAADGSGVQAGLGGTRFDSPAGCFATGSPAGREVPCLTAAHQRLLHTSYEPRPRDVHNLGFLDDLGPEDPGSARPHERIRETLHVNARRVRTAPSAAVLSAFGLTGSSEPLSGGQETAWLVDAAVLKPLDIAPVMLAWQHTLLARLAGRSDFRVSVPLRTTDGTFIADGWTAWRYESGSHRERRWREIIAVGRQLHHALAAEPEPPFLRGRTDPWSIGDKVAWGDLPASDYASNPHLGRLIAALEPIKSRFQLIHGDLSGNVLFDDALPPVVIDLSPYWRPPAFATAIVIADAVAFEGADSHIVEPLLDDPAFPQYLLRALIYRIVTDRIVGFDPSPANSEDPFAYVVELALTLADR